MTAWREAVAVAIRDGDEAEKAISGRDRDALLKLPVEQRQAIVDKKVSDHRVGNLLPDDLQIIRESLAVKKRRQSFDPIKAAVERRESESAVLRDFMATFETRLGVALPTFVEALRRTHKHPEEIAAAIRRDLLTTAPDLVIKSLFAGEYGPSRFWAGQSAWLETLRCVKRLAKIGMQYQEVAAELAAIREFSDESEISE